MAQLAFQTSDSRNNGLAESTRSECWFIQCFGDRRDEVGPHTPWAEDSRSSSLIIKNAARFALVSQNKMLYLALK
jgi:hypothetical protein